jgi:hypothetical protein
MIDNDGRHRATDGRVQSVFDFASHIQKSLDTESTSSATTLPDPSSYLKAFPLPQVEVSPNRVTLDRKGTQLWNSCRKLGWNRTETEQSFLAQRVWPGLASMMVLKNTVRALAFFMIESAQERNHKSLPSTECPGGRFILANPCKGNVRLARLGLAAAKHCLCPYRSKLRRSLLTRSRLQATYASFSNTGTSCYLR